METIRYGVPTPFPFEATSSWLSRLALAQGRPLKEVLRLLGLTSTVPLDARLVGARLLQLRRQCCLPPTAFAISDALLGSAASARLLRSRFRQDDKGRPAFAYCPLCLKTRPTGYLDIHWRLMDWRHCPIHSCLMEEQCPSCGQFLRHPVDMIRSNAGKAGHATQRRCQTCMCDLGAVSPLLVSIDALKRIHPIDACRISNGRALMAALVQGQFEFRGTRSRIASLRSDSLLAWLPTRLQWAHAERRIRDFASSEPSFGPG